jgi:hypothetical protein
VCTLSATSSAAHATVSCVLSAHHSQCGHCCAVECGVWSAHLLCFVKKQHSESKLHFFREKKNKLIEMDLSGSSDTVFLKPVLL